ncbi:MAG: alginate lyase family protein [Planctomycetaceae bacterium]|nr:heparinase II/III family protein [Planctomycetaceae bacterium]
MNAFSRLFWTARAVGWDNLPRRVLQAWRIRSGLLRKRLDPAHFSDEAFAAECDPHLAASVENWRQKATRFFKVPSPQALAAVADDDAWEQSVHRISQAALDGQYLMFGCNTAPLGWPPDFNRDPIHNIQWPVGEHWTRTAHSGPPRDDIKLVWEASRLSLAYYFARAYARSRQECWAVALWQMVDAWIEQNTPQLTVAWGCGQEMSFRLMAALFGAFATLDSPAATPQRLERLTRLAWQTGRHISININQARMQGNNHAISEAAALWTIGLLFGEFNQADLWRQRGAEVIEAEVLRQIYDDGSYVQHSLNYHRVMTDDLLWVLALARINNQPLPPAVADRLKCATQWLAQMVDPVSGHAPNYGPNDGAQVLPLSTCDYTDYRPALQAAWVLTQGRRALPPGPWDEKSLWLMGGDALAAPLEPPARESAFAARDGGYYVLRGRDSWAMTRCHSYRHRPNQADMLHVDLWHKGVNVLRDAGSYLYYSPPPWQHYFLSTAAHNTVEIDGQDQMVKGPRFLWFNWTASHLEQFEATPEGFRCIGSHEGYRRLKDGIIHRRAIERRGDVYEIIDEIGPAGAHEVALHWRLAPLEWRRHGNEWRADVAGDDYRVQIFMPPDMALDSVCGEEGPRPQGWESCYYTQRTPAPTLTVRGRVELPICVRTIVGPQGQIQTMPQEEG